MKANVHLLDIATLIPENSISNYDLLSKFDLSEDFIQEVIGVNQVTRKSDLEAASDMCVNVFNRLINKVEEISAESIQCLVVCTQNGDTTIPHTSAIVHGKLGLSSDCACFDISLGCSGYVYSLDIIISFMERNGLENGVLLTCDPYSTIIDENDKATRLLFGDAATASFLSSNNYNTRFKFELKKSIHKTVGEKYTALTINDLGKLTMNGRAIFNFCIRAIPSIIKECCEKNNLLLKDIDKCYLHQASKYMVSKVSKRIDIDNDLIPFNIENFGNTVSSSIPIIIHDTIEEDDDNILLCGFGVGLSISATHLQRKI
jgi:3-oxoacyl-[acyl-carrier-protein] synthase-3